MHELAITAAKAGWELEDIANLAKDETKLRSILSYMKGYAEINTVEHVIDCDADPLIPFDGWKVEEHKKAGSLKWDATKVKFHLSDKQKNGKTIEGNKLRKELADMPVMNANVLDYLMRNPHLIPEEWKKTEKGETRYIFFWGTIYRGSGGYLSVRCLSFDGGYWRSGSRWLGHVWIGSLPAALLAS